MKKIMINGYAYYYDNVTNKLFLEDKTTEVAKRFFTANEYMQFLTGIQYNGKPMYSF